MARPPKPVKPSSNTDTPSNTLKPSVNDPRERGDGSANIPRTLPDTDRPSGSNGSNTSGESAGALPHRAVVVTDMPTSAINTAEAIGMISWPRDQVDQLFQIDNTGLFMDSQQQLYADVGAEGIFRIETNAHNEFQIPLPFAPGQAGPILMKVPGQPQWRIARPGQTAPTDLPTSPTALEIIPRHLTHKLTKPDSNGLRFDKLKRTYVDLIDGGTVLVRRNAQGDYQASSANETTPSGPVLESMEGMTLWQRKSLDSPPSEEPGPGPSKKPRLDKEAQTSPGAGVAASINPYLWASWGKIRKPETGEFIQIGQLYYPIVPKGPLTDRLPLVFLQHPNFAPARFEAFESMLLHTPDLQPVIGFRSMPQVVSSAIRPFAKPLTKHVGDAFTGFTENTSRAVAKHLFDLSSGSQDIDGSGLARMMQTLRHWEGTSDVAVKGFGDPLDMLPAALGSGEASRIVPLHSADSLMHLQQLNFNPELSSVWNLYKDALDAPGRISLLLSSLLSKSNYKVFLPRKAEHLKFNPPTLVFKRNNHAKVYFLKLGYIETDAIKIRPPTMPELRDPMLHMRMSAEGHQALLGAEVRGDVVWLIGGVQHLPGREPAIFIIKER
ncbi:hypothetical protein [Pseudomonas sp. LB3P31]